MRRFANFFVMAVFLLGFTRPAQAQAGVKFVDARVGYDFGEQITFSARIESPNPIKEIQLLFRDEREENTRVIPLQADPDGFVSYQYDAASNLLRPFAKIIFWFQVILQDGGTAQSANYSFRYADDRFDWVTRQEKNISVHWYDGDEAFGMAALDAARNGLQTIQGLFPVEAGEPINIYIYSSPTELQETLFMGGETWVAGHASPALGVALVSIKPSMEQNIAMQQQIPHELAHVMLYRYVGEEYDRLPTWLQEGISSIAELYPNPDYQRALDVALENEMLIPMADLCDPFPRDASRAFLAYAESASFTRYLYNAYGSLELDDLIRAYADGLSCEPGATQALGASLTYLDARWRESVLGANLLGVAWRNFLPYLILFGLILIVPLAEGIAMLRRRKKDGN